MDNKGSGGVGGRAAGPATVEMRNAYAGLIIFGLCLGLALASWWSVRSAWPDYVTATLAFGAALVGGVTMVVGAVRAIWLERLGVDLLASIALIASIVIGEYLAAAIIALMLIGGNALSSYTRAKAHKSIEELMEAGPRVARIQWEGKAVEVPIGRVRVGDVALVKSGERVPVDGVVVSGHASVNQAPITGEPIPVEKTTGSEVFSGSLLELGALEVRVTRVGEESTLGRIVKLIEEGLRRKAPIERLADKYAKWFTPAMALVAILVYFLTRNPIATVAVLLVACPCALILATPTAVAASIGSAAKRGILFKGGEPLETLGRADTVVFDKTGTVTVGKPSVTGVRGFSGRSEGRVVELAAIAEKLSSHPLAVAILSKAEELGIKVRDPSEFEVLPGLGVVARVDETEVVVGNKRLLERRKVEIDPRIRRRLRASKGETLVFVCENGAFVGTIGVADIPKVDAKTAVRGMKKLGIGKIVMLTGDAPASAEKIAGEVGIDEVGSELLPEDKVSYLERLRGEGRRVVMVGDGINDGPALVAADVGVSIGRADVTAEAADVAVTTEDVSKISRCIEFGRKALSVIRQNIVIALAVNVAGIVLAAQGLISPILAATIHEGNSLVVVLNSARLIGRRQKRLWCLVAARECELCENRDFCIGSE